MKNRDDVEARAQFLSTVQSWQFRAPGWMQPLMDLVGAICTLATNGELVAVAGTLGVAQQGANQVGGNSLVCQAPLLANNVSSEEVSLLMQQRADRTAAALAFVEAHAGTAAVSAWEANIRAAIETVAQAGCQVPGVSRNEEGVRALVERALAMLVLHRRDMQAVAARGQGPFRPTQHGYAAAVIHGRTNQG